MPLVDYLIARDELPAPRGLAYDYLLGGDGLYLAARNRYLDVRVPVARTLVRGLPPLYPSVTIRTGRLPFESWRAIVATASEWCDANQEVLLAVVHNATAGYRLVRPEQVTGRTRLVYQPIDDVVLEIHSHHRFPAFFSTTDDADEQALRLYGVLGRLDTNRPEVAVRVGAFGYFLPIPWETVFTGERGAFRDRSVEETEATEGVDQDVPDAEEPDELSD